MVSTTMLYRGPPIEDWPDCPSVDFTQYMAYEPGQQTYWSSQGVVTTDLPFTGGARITSGFWSHESFRFIRWTLGPHGGIDFIPMAGDAMVRVMVPGTVVGNAWSEGTGNITTLELADTFPRTYMDYAHLETLPELEIGDRLEFGDPLAVMGETGTYATGRHLHMSTYTMVTPEHSWQSWINRRFLDPLPYFGDMFDPAPGGGVTLTTFKGGLIDLLNVEGQEHDLASISVTHLGDYLTYVPGAPPFVNQPFIDHFPEEWIHAGTAMLAAQRENP